MKKLIVANIMALTLTTGIFGIDSASAKNNKELEETPKLNLCINDNINHGDEMEAFARKTYKGDVTRIDIYTKNIFDKKELHEGSYDNCSVINYSWNLLPTFFVNGEKLEDNMDKFEELSSSEYAVVDRFLDHYKGIVVSSAGNEENVDTILSSRIARYKRMNDKLGINKNEDRIFVIGQVEKNSNGGYNHKWSEGDKIDYVVANYMDTIEDKDNPGTLKPQVGTSMASASVSGLFAQILDMGVPQEDLRSVLGFEDKDHVWKGVTYKVLSFPKSLENAKNYVSKK